MSMSEDFQALKQHQKEQRKSQYETNMEALFDSEFNYPRRFEQPTEGVVCFREKGKPKVDFYPSKNKWWSHEEKKVHFGSAVEFLEWYRGL